jgi:hypothetical protein
MRAQSVTIEFEKFGNRRGFTGLRLMQDPVSREFYEHFKHRFEPLLNQDAVVFIEGEKSGSDA